MRIEQGIKCFNDILDFSAWLQAGHCLEDNEVYISAVVRSYDGTSDDFSPVFYGVCIIDQRAVCECFSLDDAIKIALHIRSDLSSYL